MLDLRPVFRVNTVDGDGKQERLTCRVCFSSTDSFSIAAWTLPCCAVRQRGTLGKV